ncbi:hypothetical protein [Streptomyces sp. NBC_01275]|uniref:ISAzo13-like element transposase-related protein n=1 Tax=Streptomyces sp. NBC_01275 TaxID=2903807 RepID=UPI00338FCAD4
MLDTKQKELADPFKNTGHAWEPRRKLARVDARDFPDRELGRTVPYGIVLAVDHCSMSRTVRSGCSSCR